MILLGVNRLMSAEKLADGESPDSANAFFYKDKIGLLGPRKGVSVFNAAPYANDVTGLIPFYVGVIRKFIVPLDSGALTVVTSPFANPAAGVLPAKTRLFLANPLSLSLSFPDLTGSAQQLFASGAVLGPFASGEITGIMVPMPSFSVSWSGPGDATLEATLTVTVL